MPKYVSGGAGSIVCSSLAFWSEIAPENASDIFHPQGLRKAPSRLRPGFRSGFRLRFWSAKCFRYFLIPRDSRSDCLASRLENLQVDRQQRWESCQDFWSQNKNSTLCVWATCVQDVPGLSAEEVTTLSHGYTAPLPQFRGFAIKHLDKVRTSFAGDQKVLLLLFTNVVRIPCESPGPVHRALQRRLVPDDGIFPTS